jgi:hypothetical protein
MFLIFKILNRWGLCLHAPSVKTGDWGVICQPLRSGQHCFSLFLYDLLRICVVVKLFLLSSCIEALKLKLGQNKNEVLVGKLNMQNAFICSFAWYEEPECSRMLTEWIIYSIVFYDYKWFSLQISSVWYVAYEIFSSSRDDVILTFYRSKQQRLYQANHSKLTLRFDFLEWRLFAMTKSGLIAWLLQSLTA